jgi:gliding motility-associated-like protein
MDSVQVTVGGVSAIINATPLSGDIPLDVTLDGSSSTGAISSWDWTFGDGSTGAGASTSNTYTDIGTYTVELIVSDGTCSDTTTITIDAYGESAVLIPNVFTPNGDGSNDIFTVEGVNLESVEGEIFNRWGQKMFSWSNVKGHWDGRTLSGSEAPDGTYYYIINAKGLDGEEYYKKGGFSLIR